MASEKRATIMVYSMYGANAARMQPEPLLEGVVYPFQAGLLASSWVTSTPSRKTQ